MGAAAVLEHLQRQAGTCRTLGAPFTAALCEAAAEDLRRAGPVADVLAGDGREPGPSALGLRLVGALQRLVLAGDAPALGRCYPTDARPGGDPAAAVALLPAVVAEHVEVLRRELGAAPQTNEVGRTAALWGGVLRLVAEGVGRGLPGTGPAGQGGAVPVRLVDVGASAGLLLQADRVRMVGDDGSACGPPGSPVRLAAAWDVAPWSGPGDGGPVREPPPTRVVAREGVDVAPLDVAREQDSRRLRSFVWPEQRDRVHRLEGAIALARAHPVPLRRAGAGELARGLGLRPGVVTVVWHAVVRQYVPAGELSALDAALVRLGREADAAGGGAPLVHLALEPARPVDGGPSRFVLSATVSGAPGVPHGPRELGEAGPHGPPVRWSGPPGPGPGAPAPAEPSPAPTGPSPAPTGPSPTRPVPTGRTGGPA
ncbi:DUF2332 domain-containing protein [Pseudokineococcus basanitobsidens]|uniref:DUF2332 domain-containing protein n=1 Tax=Pseudokineococcus basanitobsidens TaxID=1926649 RepID=A0ABU8RIT1_9ACTN